MATEARSSSQIPKLPQSGPYLARVVSHLDRKFMGALEVELLKMTDSGNLPETTGMTREVRYLSPFYGTTPYKDLTKNDNDQVFIFNGWTFASDPNLTPFDHAIYGLQLLNCKST